MPNTVNEPGNDTLLCAEAVPPGTSRHLEKMIERHKDEWPEELLMLAGVAKLTLAMIENNPQHVIDAIKANAPNTWTTMVGDLMAFAEAYGAWKASR